MTKTPSATPCKTSPTPHQAYVRGRLTRAGIVTPTDAAAYLDGCDERTAVAFALGANEGDARAMLTATDVDRHVDEVLDARYTTPASQAVSPRVARLLGDLGVDVESFRACANSRSVSGSRGLAARRAVVHMLRAAGLSVREVAAETGLWRGTIREHLRAARSWR